MAGKPPPDEGNNLINPLLEILGPSDGGGADGIMDAIFDTANEALGLDKVSTAAQVAGVSATERQTDILHNDLGTGFTNLAEIMQRGYEFTFKSLAMLGGRLLFGFIRARKEAKAKAARENQLVGSTNQQIMDLDTTLQGVGTSLLGGLSALAAGGGEGKEERQEQRMMFNSLFTNLGETISEPLDRLGASLKDMQKSGGLKGFLMMLVKPLLLVAGAYLFRTFKVLQTTTNALKVFGKAVSGFIPKLFLFAKNGVIKIFTAIKSPIAAFFQRIFKTLQTGVGKIGSFLGRVVKTIGGKLKPVFDFFSKVVGRLKPVFDPVIKIFQNVFTKAKPVFSTIGGFFGKIGTFAKGTGGVLTKVGGVFGSIGKAVKPVFGILKPIMGFVGKIGKFFKAVPILGQVITVIEGIVGFFRGFFGTEGSFFDKLIAGVQGIFAQIISGLTFGLVSFDGVMGFFDDVSTALGNFFFKLFEFFTITLPEKVSGAFDRMIGFFTETIPNFFTETVPNVFKRLMVNIGLAVLRVRKFIADKLSYIGLGEDTDELDRQIAAGERFLEVGANARSQQTSLEQTRDQTNQRLGQQRAGDVAVVTNNNNVQSFETSEEPATERDPYAYVSPNLAAF